DGGELGTGRRVVNATPLGQCPASAALEPPGEVSVSMTYDFSGRSGRLLSAFAAISLVFAAASAGAQTPPAVPATPADPNAVVATVDGVKLTERDVQL